MDLLITNQQYQNPSMEFKDTHLEWNLINLVLLKEI